MTYLLVIYALPLILVVGVWYQINRWVSAGKPKKLLLDHQAIRNLGFNLFGIQFAAILLFFYLITVEFSLQLALIIALSYSGLGIYLGVIKELTRQKSPKPEKLFNIQKRSKETVS